MAQRREIPAQPQPQPGARRGRDCKIGGKDDGRAGMPRGASSLGGQQVGDGGVEALQAFVDVGVAD
ncbi:hypothetical protein, partial [Chromobacterium sp. ASV23]|uniref:hypothetical protein n=1 Tax=Chromobacterium sp. ASV23 TaxID=2795110 RepID=UPI001E30B98C